MSETIRYPEALTDAQAKNLAQKVRSSLAKLGAPLIIEFSGTPRSGKTTCVDAIAKFLRRNKVPVKILVETASMCPIPNKRDLFFNLWTLGTILTRLLEAHYEDASVILIDRGFFDTLVWLNLFLKDHVLTQNELSRIESFLGITRILDLTSVVVAVSVEPQISLDREYQTQLATEYGSIMNPKVLKAYNESLLECTEKYGNLFPNVLLLDTSRLEPMDAMLRISLDIVSRLEKLADERVAVIDKETLLSKVGAQKVCDRAKEVKALQDLILKESRWMKRSTAEETSNVIQIIPVSVFRSQEEILVTYISEEQKSMHLHHKRSVWVGGHARERDMQENRGDFLREALRREIGEELKLELTIQDIPASPTALIYDKTTVRSRRHLCILYEIELMSRVVHDSLDRSTRKESRNKSLYCEFHQAGEQLQELSDWEEWSVLYLNKKLHLEIPMPPRKLELEF